jgi:hypothetical protein
MTKPLPPEKRKRRFDVVDWTETRVELLRAMFADRRSASEMAYAVQGGATRNAVIGKLHRLGLRHESAVVAAKRRDGQLASAATKRARSERERVVSGQALAERREKQAAAGRAAIAKVELRLVAKPAFVAREKPADDLYAHMRTEAGYHAAIAALSRRRATEKGFVRWRGNPTRQTAKNRSRKGCVRKT